MVENDFKKIIILNQLTLTMGEMDGVFSKYRPCGDLQVGNRSSGPYQDFSHPRLPAALSFSEPSSSHYGPSTDQIKSPYSSPFMNNRQLHELQSLPRDYKPAKFFSQNPLLNRRKGLLRCESEVTLNKVYERGKNFKMGGVEYNSSPEDQSNGASFFPQQHIKTYATKTTQTEQSPFEEKFLIRETILFGCDIVSELSSLEPSMASELQECAEYVREKTLQSRSQDVCSKFLSEDIDNIIVVEYVKAFIRISDTWLDARNCFGLSAQCVSETCNLKSRNLSRNYLEWMHASRKLMESIVQGMEWAVRGRKPQFDTFTKKSNFDCRGTQSESHIPRTQDLHQQTVFQQRPKWAVPPCQPEGPGGLWGYPPIPPCHCGLNAQPFKDNERKYERDIWNPANASTNYPGHIIKAHSAMELGRRVTGEILKPGSYNVERAMVTPGQKIVNILKAKASCCQDLILNRGYVVTFANKQGGATECNQGSKDTGNEEMMENSQSRKRNDEWLTKQLEKGLKDCIDPLLSEPADNDTDSQTSIEKNWDYYFSEYKPVGRKTILKHRRTLNQKYLSHIQDIIQELWKCDWPDGFRSFHSEHGKTLKPLITLETITNKAKNAIYETVEQFVHDCRKLLANATNYFIQKDKNTREKMDRIESEFEAMLENHFERSDSWDHICGDPKETNFYPELRYLNKKRTKMPRIVAENIQE